MSIFKKVGRKILSGPEWIAKPVASCIEWYESAYGPVYARRHQQESCLNGRSIRNGIEQIRLRWPEVQSNEAQSPVFILSAGWRSGSTLVQRMVMSDPSVLIWGEPYSHARLISHLAKNVSAFTETWPEDSWFVDQYDMTKLNKTFVANMYPPVTDMQQACISYFKTMFELPAKERGFERWGIKDVRLTAEDAHFIKWLFPEAKFVLLCRNPYDAYKSYRQDRSWYYEWPDKPVFTATDFGRHWSNLTSGFYTGASELDALFVRYEDILNESEYSNNIETYLGIDIDKSLLANKVGSHESSSKKLPSSEFKQLDKQVKEMANELGYKYISE